MKWLFLISPKKFQTRNGRAFILEEFLGREGKGLPEHLCRFLPNTQNTGKIPQGFTAATATIR